MVGLFLAAALAQAQNSPVNTSTQSSRKSLSAARDRCEEILTQDPANVVAQQGEVQASERLALDDSSAHDIDGALADLLRAQRFAPENARLLYDLGVQEEAMQLYHDADTTVSHLRVLQPADSSMYYLAARVEMDLGRLPEAEQDMRAYLKAHPDDATAHYGLGRILQLSQQPAAAKPEFERAVELKPAQTESYYQLGQLALQADDYETVLREDAMVLGRNGHHGGALADTGIAYFRLRRYTEAEQALERATIEAPEYHLGHYYFGLVLAKLGKKEQSDRELAMATKLVEDENRKAGQRLRLQQ